MLAESGQRILLIDRDNPPKETKRRLKAWGVTDSKPGSLHVMTRDRAPSLNDTESWKAFPHEEYDMVILDSLDATAEGMGEKDSSMPSRAIAPLLDIARKPSGPAILILCNTVKSGKHGRGSGVIEDRADICFEVRDSTDLMPTGTKPWWEELPEAGVEKWSERATRRKKRDHYNLAFVPSKFRIGEEPEPFILEINLSGDEWSCRDVTADVERDGRQQVEEVERQRQQKEQAALTALEGVVSKGNPMKIGDAVEFLRDRGLRRKDARQHIVVANGLKWRVHERADMKGKPKFLFPVDEVLDPSDQKGFDLAEIT